MDNENISLESKLALALAKIDELEARINSPAETPESIVNAEKQAHYDAWWRVVSHKYHTPDEPAN